MDKDQYWILNLLMEVGCRLVLIDPEEIGWHFYPGHGLNRGRLVDVLHRLLQDGDLIAQRDDLGSEAETFLPTPAEIEAVLLTGVPEVSIFLTPQGGQRWEEASAPDWNRYISTEWWERNGWGAASADRSLVECYWKSPEVQARVIPGSEGWDVLSPWEVTYWKTLPTGYRVRFRLTPSEEESPWASPDPDWYANPYAEP